MRRTWVGMGIAAALLSLPFLVSTIFEFSRAMTYYFQCVDSLTMRDLGLTANCRFSTEFAHMLMITIAIFSIFSWLILKGLKDISIRKNQLALGAAISVIVSTLATLSSRGIMSLAFYRKCLEDCPSGVCGGATSTSPMYECTFPSFEFAIPLFLLGIGCLMLVGSIRKKSLRPTVQK